MCYVRQKLSKLNYWADLDSQDHFGSRENLWENVKCKQLFESFWYMLMDEPEVFVINVEL